MESGHWTYAGGPETKVFWEAMIFHSGPRFSTTCLRRVWTLPSGPGAAPGGAGEKPDTATAKSTTMSVGPKLRTRRTVASTRVSRAGPCQQANVHLGYCSLAIPDRACWVHQLGIWPIGCTVARTVLTVPSICKGAGQGVSGLVHFRGRFLGQANLTSSLRGCGLILMSAMGRLRPERVEIGHCEFRQFVAPFTDARDILAQSSHLGDERMQ